MPYNNPNNETYSVLWNSFLQGDREAFSEIYKSSYSYLYSYGMSFNITEDQVRDNIQDIFIKLYTKPSVITEKNTFRPFLFASMRNACINSLKAERKHFPLEEVEEFNISFSIQNNPVEEKEEEEKLQDYIRNILEQLSPRQREIIYLRFLHQMEYEEISKVMKLSEQAARNLTHRAINKIRKDNTYYDLMLLLLLFILICKQADIN